MDQGYAFKVITHLNGIKEMKDLAFQTPQERRELLADVLLQNETAADAEKIDGDLFSMGPDVREPGRRASWSVALLRRHVGRLLRRPEGMAYVEFNKNKNKELKGKGNTFIRKLRREEGQTAGPRTRDSIPESESLSRLQGVFQFADGCWARDEIVA